MGVKIFQEIAELVSPIIEDMGYELVQVRMIGGARRTLQIMVEPADHGRGMTLDECAELSHAVSAVLDVADPIPGAYSLEMSSPGIDRPLVRASDFSRFAGHLAKIELMREIDGRRKFNAVLAGAHGEIVRVEEDGKTLELDFSEIKKAKLVLTDELIKSHQKAQAFLEG